MPTLTISKSIRLGDGSSNEVIQSTGTGVFQRNVEVGPAKVGALTTRTDDNTGELTMNSGHGITTGARLDVFWVGGSRRGMTVGTVATNAVPIDGGAGDNLPVDETAITAMVPTEEVLVATGNDVNGIEAYSSLDGLIVVAQSGGTEIVAIDSDEGGYAWSDNDGTSNPVSGASIGKVFFSHGDSTATAKMRIQFLMD